MIRIKNASVLSSLLSYRFHPKLVGIMEYVADKYGMMITEGFRPAKHPNDVHSTDPVRAIDLRFRFYEEATAYLIKDDLNNNWEYDVARPQMEVAIIHGDGDNKHFHIQVHSNTKKRRV